MQLKRCSRCKEEKQLEYYAFNKSTKDGYYCYCKKCNLEIQQERKQKYQNNGYYKVDKKVCIKCLQEKDSQYFSIDKSKSTGLMSRCKECIKKDLNEKRLTDSTFREKENLRTKEYRKQKRINRKEYYQKLKERHLNGEIVYNSTQLCTSCNIEKIRENFHVDLTQLSGLKRICKVCKNEQTRGIYAQERVKQLKYNESTYSNKDREYYLANRERILARTKKYRENNPTKVAEAKKQSRLKKLDYYKAKNAQYKKQVKIATPTCLNEQYREQILHIYEMCPPGYEVDHIIPLKGNEVCGLHVPWNLQYLPASVNNAKNNKLLTEEEINQIEQKHIERDLINK